MLKALGGFMIFAGSLGMGFWYRGQFTGRIEALRILRTILELLCSEIRYGRGTLPECCGQVASRVPKTCGRALRQVSERMSDNGGENFADVFRSCMEGPLKEMPITREDREEFFRFVSESGFMDGQMQMRMIEASKEQLEEKTKSLERENAEKCRMAVGLGAMGGLLILLILC